MLGDEERCAAISVSKFQTHGYSWNQSHSPLNYFSTQTQTYIHMKRAGVSHRGELWGDDKVETGRNVFECVSANTSISAKCSSSLKICFVNQITHRFLKGITALSLYHTLKRLPHAHRR